MSMEAAIAQTKDHQYVPIGIGHQLAGRYMTFKVANEVYGLEILKVREIIGLMPITSVPMAPSHVRGVINLRGKVEPVVDIKLGFGMSRTEPTDQTVIIVVQHEDKNMERTMGIMVDEVLEVRSIEAHEIEPPPEFGASAVDGDVILGIGKHKKDVIFLLDIGKVFTSNMTFACLEDF